MNISKKKILNITHKKLKKKNKKNPIIKYIKTIYPKASTASAIAPTIPELSPNPAGTI